MSATALQLSPAEYLARERDAEQRHEYIDGEMRPMAGATFLHNIVAFGFGWLLESLLVGRPFVVCVNDMRVRIPDGPYYYPDAVVVPSPPEMEDAAQDTLLNPLVVVEVLSPSTAAIDRGEKLDNYRLIPSLTDYVLLFQDKIRAEHYSRVSADEWRLVTRDGAGASVRIESLGIDLPLEEVYRRWSAER